MQTDLRTRYTRQVITDAFLQLLRQKPVERITVKEVCALAQINRSTFYRQYKDCFDLMEQLEQRGLELLEELLQAAQAQGTAATMTSLLCALRDNDSLLGIMARQNQDERFLYAMVGRCFRYMNTRQENMATAVNETQQNMRNAFLAAGVGGIIQYWLRSGMQTEPRQAAAVIAALCEGAAMAAMPQ